MNSSNHIIRLYLAKHPYIQTPISSFILELTNRGVESIIGVGKVYVVGDKSTVKANLDIRLITDLLTLPLDNKDIYIFSGDVDFLYPCTTYNHKNRNSLCRFIYWPSYCNREVSETYVYRTSLKTIEPHRFNLLCPYEDLDNTPIYNREYCLLIDANNLLGRIDNNYKELMNIINSTITTLDSIYRP